MSDDITRQAAEVKDAVRAIISDNLRHSTSIAWDSTEALAAAGLLVDTTDTRTTSDSDEITDLVWRLREFAKIPGIAPCRLCHDAADLIERLRAIVDTATAETEAEDAMEAADRAYDRGDVSVDVYIDAVLALRAASERRRAVTDRTDQ